MNLAPKIGEFNATLIWWWQEWGKKQDNKSDHCAKYRWNHLEPYLFKNFWFIKYPVFKLILPWDIPICNTLWNRNLLLFAMKKCIKVQQFKIHVQYNWPGLGSFAILEVHNLQTDVTSWSRLSGLRILDQFLYLIPLDLFFNRLD